MLGTDFSFFSCVQFKKIKSTIMFHLGLMVCEKLKIKISVYFITSAFSFIVNIVSTNPFLFQACSKQVPNLIIQYGVPRTATTLQFEILCLMMAFLHEDEKNSVGCFYFINPNSKYKVIKVHHISSILPSIRPGSWVFMTSKGPLTDKLRQKVIQLKQKHIDVPYIADVNLVSKRGHFIAYEYQKIFGLTDEQMKHVVEFLRYWDIIRVCCGIQMSADWRNHLAPNKTYRQHHDTNSLSYPACEMYNISSVEALLLNTRAFKTFSNISTLSNVIGKPSVVDGYLNGSYCKRCSENISKHNLKFNEKCL